MSEKKWYVIKTVAGQELKVKDYIEARGLVDLIANFSSSRKGFLVSQKKFKDFNAVFYEISQNGKLTKAVYFHNHKKSYMLQVSSEKNSQKLFDEFINTFELIEK